MLVSFLARTLRQTARTSATDWRKAVWSSEEPARRLRLFEQAQFREVLPRL